MDKIELTEELLEEAINNGRSSREVADETGWHQTTVARRARELGLKFDGRPGPEPDKLGSNYRFCSVCGQQCKNSESGLCWDHWQQSTVEEYGDSVCVGDLEATNSRHRFQNARNHAHRVAKWMMDDEKVCAVCGYDIYVELCHIKPISEFDDGATLTEVNDPDNLIWLCPNHHKEQELGLLAGLA